MIMHNIVDMEQQYKRFSDVKIDACIFILCPSYLSEFFSRNPTLRYSLCLSTSEKEFIEQRKEKILEAMRRLLGDEEGPKNIDEVFLCRW